MDNDLISRQAIKKKLQEHYNFLVDVYGGFENMPSNIKLRVDEITNCIAEVVNIPAVQPEQKTGWWEHDGGKFANRWICSQCGYKFYFEKSEAKYCPNCGAYMKGENNDKTTSN